MAKKNFLKIILLTGDIALMYFVLFLTLTIRPGNINLFLIHFSIIYLFWLLILFIFDFYEISYVKRTTDFFRKLGLFLIFATAFSIAYFYLQPELAIAPKTILFLYLLIFTFLFSCWRYFFTSLLRLKNLKEKVIIVGDCEREKGLQDFLSSIQGNGYEVISLISNASQLEVVEKKEVDLIVLTADFYKNKKLIHQFFSKLPFDANYISFIDFYESLTGKIFVDTLDEIWFFENVFRQESKINQILKRGFDLFFTLLGLLIAIILFPLIALSIKIDSPGPVIYSQKRIGKNGKVFILYKFRTMVVDAEKDGPQWTRENDSRITRVGKILRALHLDELPQLYNILRGDISFIGPRPERPEFVFLLKKEIPYYDIRHLVKPGLTGWAQIKYHYGASVEEAKEKLKYELYYLKNQSLALDLVIFLKTIQLLLIKVLK